MLKILKWGYPRGFEEQGNMVIYFKRTRDIFGINFREQGISVLLKGTLTKKLEKNGIYHDGKQGCEKVKFPS